MPENHELLVLIEDCKRRISMLEDAKRMLLEDNAELKENIKEMAQRLTIHLTENGAVKAFIVGGTDGNKSA